MVLKQSPATQYEDHRAALMAISKQTFEDWQLKIKEYELEHRNDDTFRFSCYGDATLNLIAALISDFHCEAGRCDIPYSQMLNNLNGLVTKIVSQEFGKYMHNKANIQN